MTPSLSDLISRVEGASEGDREIDGDVLVACGCRFRQRGTFEIIEWPDGQRIRGDRIPVTSSLDAALALVERVLPGWEIHVLSNPWHCEGRGCAYAGLTAPDERQFTVARDGSTRPLVLILALLTALQEGIGN